MNNLTVGIISFIGGAAAGGVGAWLITKNIMQKRNDEELAGAHARYREKLKASGVVEEEDSEESEESDDEESHPETPDDKIDKNAGVKKYWHPVDKSSLDEEFNRVGKEIKDVTENERVAEIDPSMDEVPGISLISEDDYTTDQGFEKIDLQYFCGDDALQILNPDGTTGDSADLYFRNEYRIDNREEVIGKYMRWAPDYLEPGSSNGYVYIKNDNLKIEIEIEVLDGFYMDDEDIKIGPNGDLLEDQ